MVELRNLSVGFSNRVILKDISISCLSGKVIALVGPKGCGKSSFLRTIVRLQEKLGGEILIDNLPIEVLSARQIAQKVAYLPQSRNVPNITARRMVLYGRFPYLSFPRHYRKEDFVIVEDSLRQMEAEQIADCPMQQLSERQRQKVYLAMALAQKTDTILLDEPMTYLDSKCQFDIMQTVHRLAKKGKGKSVIVALRDLCLAMQYSDEIVVFYDGGLPSNSVPTFPGYTVLRKATEVPPRW